MLFSDKNLWVEKVLYFSDTTRYSYEQMCQNIVGTHLDAVSAQEAKELEDEARIKYSNTAIYPKVA